MASLKSGLLYVGFVGAFGLLGCQKVGSSSIKTSGMYADLSVTANGDGMSHVRAALRVGGPLSNTFVDLQPGDSISAAMNGMMTQTLNRTPELFGAVSYTGTFTGDTAGTPFSISFMRTSDTSAPSSTATLPMPFSITAPTANAVVSRAMAMPITWSTTGGAPGDLVDITLTGTCVQILTKLAQTDNGQVTIMASELKPVSGSQSMTCGVTVTIARKHAGTVDPAFGSGGTAFGIQQRTINISSTP